MNCREARTSLSAFHDGELGRSESEAVRAHLLDCASCRREVAELRSITRSLEPESVPKVSDGFTDAVMARLRSGEGAFEARASRADRDLRRLALAAVVVLSVGALFLVMPVSLSSLVRGTLDAASSSDVDREIDRNNALARGAAGQPGSRPADLRGGAGRKPSTPRPNLAPDRR